MANLSAGFSNCVFLIISFLVLHGMFDTIQYGLSKAISQMENKDMADSGPLNCRLFFFSFIFLNSFDFPLYRQKEFIDLPLKLFCDFCSFLPKSHFLKKNKENLKIHIILGCDETVTYKTIF